MGVGEGFEVPQSAAPWSDFHWFSVAPRECLNLVVLSERPMWYTGHFYRGRMAPCLEERCQACSEGIGSQIRYAFGVAEITTKRVGMIEMGRGNGLMLQDWSIRAGGLRGLMVEFSKHSKQSQSRTEVKYIDHPPPLWIDGLDGPDVGLALYLTWEKAGFGVPTDLRERYGGRHSRSRT